MTPMPSNEADIRNAALEEAAKVAESVKAPKSIGRDKGSHHEAGAQHAARLIRALKSDPAPVPATKPFTFADPAAQREHERIRAESRKGRGE